MNEGSLSGAQVKWLQSLVRMQIKKVDRSLAGFAPKSGQSEQEAEEFRAHLVEKRMFAEATLASLSELRADDSGFGLREAAMRGLTQLRTTADGGIVVGPQGWANMQKVLE